MIEWIYKGMDGFIAKLVDMVLTGKLGWVMRDWLPLAVALVVFGLLVDAVVWIVRYQPYKRWAQILHTVTSFIGSLFGKKRPAPAAEVREKVYNERIEKSAAPRTQRTPTAPPAAQDTQRHAPPSGPRPAPQSGPRPAPQSGPRPAPQSGPRPVRRPAANTPAELYQPAPPMSMGGEPTTRQRPKGDG